VEGAERSRSPRCKLAEPKFDYIFEFQEAKYLYNDRFILQWRKSVIGYIKIRSPVDFTVNFKSPVAN